MITLIISGLLIWFITQGLMNPREWGVFQWVCLLVLMAIVYLNLLVYFIGKEKRDGDMG
jgi:hypothetical protein